MAIEKSGNKESRPTNTGRPTTGRGTGTKTASRSTGSTKSTTGSRTAGTKSTGTANGGGTRSASGSGRAGSTGTTGRASATPRKSNTLRPRPSSYQEEPVERSRGRYKGENYGRVNETMTDEIILIVVLLICIIMVLSYFGICGIVGTGVNAVIFGLFGKLGYALPFILLLFTLFFAANDGRFVSKSKVVCSIVFMIIVAALVQMFGYGYDPELGLGSYFTNSLLTYEGEAPTGGGFLGGLVVKILCPLFGSVGAVIIMLAVALMMMVVITGKAFVSYFSKRVKETTKSRLEERRIAREERRIYDDIEGYDEDSYEDDDDSVPSTRHRMGSIMVSSGKKPKVLSPEEQYIAEANEQNEYSSDEAVEENPAREIATSPVKTTKKPSAKLFTGRKDNTADISSQSLPDGEKPALNKQVAVTSNQTATGKEAVKSSEYSENKFSDKSVELPVNNGNADFGNAKSLKSGSVNNGIEAAKINISFDTNPENGEFEYGPKDFEEAENTPPSNVVIIRNLEQSLETDFKVDLSDMEDVLGEDETPLDRSPLDNRDTLTTKSSIRIVGLDTNKSSDNGPSNVSTLPVRSSDTPDETPKFEDSVSYNSGNLNRDDVVDNSYNTADTIDTVNTANEYSNANSVVIANAYNNDNTANTTNVDNVSAGSNANTTNSTSAEKASDYSGGGSTSNSTTEPAQAYRDSSGAVRFTDMSAEALEKATPPEPEYIFPPIEFLRKGKVATGNAEEKQRELYETIDKLQRTFESFGVGVKVTDASVGPTVTRYELLPDQGVKVKTITSLSDDIKLALAAAEIRIEAPIPGKAAVGIEVPNKENVPVFFGDLIDSDEFRNSKSKLSIAIGKDISGKSIVSDIAGMPHALIAGATGSGKSVCINALIMSILYKAKPSEVKLIMIDPKRVELVGYNGIPHLLVPVVTDVKKATGALNWAIAEMDDRYKRFADCAVTNLASYNELMQEQYLAEGNEGESPDKLPQIVIIVDELNDLMMTANSKEVEGAICRLTQLARACGIHVVLATQRPSVNVITGTIKANIPTRMAFAVSSLVDSRTIIDQAGAEKLLGKGDMLFYPQGYPKPVRLQGAFVSDGEVKKVVDHIKATCRAVRYSDAVSKHIETNSEPKNTVATEDKAERSGGRDELFEEAGKFIIEKEKASIGMLQRVYKIGFNRAARIMDQLCDAGVVGPEEGTKPRKILMTVSEFEEFINLPEE